MIVRSFSISPSDSKMVAHGSTNIFDMIRKLPQIQCANGHLVIVNRLQFARSQK